MSVLVSDRKESKFEVVTYSEELHLMLIDLMRRNFGIKDLKHMVRKRYFNKEELGQSDIAYYLSVLHCSINNIQSIATLLTNNVRAANSIYPICTKDFEVRRGYQDAAIVNCEQLVKELQHIVTLFNVDVNIFDRCISAIDREIHLIKRWRQKDQKLMSKQNGNV